MKGLKYAEQRETYEVVNSEEHEAEYHLVHFHFL